MSSTTRKSNCWPRDASSDASSLSAWLRSEPMRRNRSQKGQESPASRGGNVSSRLDAARFLVTKE
eukprot:scaffold2739_cov257-Pinguiococcus_pyrenoidosus.AAC.26